MNFSTSISFLRCIVVLILIGINTGWGQSHEQVKQLDSSVYLNQLDALNMNFGINKTIPAEIILPTLTALSYFPELKVATIKFKKAKINTSLNARPKLTSLIFRRKAKRKYVIRYADNGDTTKVLLKDAPFNAQVGVIGHELNHIADYSIKNFFGVLGRGFAYANKKKKENFEKHIDQMTIEKGLGWQLYAWASFILDGETATEEYKAFKREVYLEPIEILNGLK